MRLAEIHPPSALTLRCGDVELRWLDDSSLERLVDVALEGVHAPDFMPFTSPWTTLPREQIPAAMVQFHWGERAVSADDWTLNFGTWWRGELVGSQSLGAKQFALLRTCTSGSWLGLRHQGHGIGTLQRQMVVALAFDHLGAVECRSGAFADNAASLGVSRKVGYRITDTRRTARADDVGWQLHHDLMVTPDTFVRPEQPVEVTGLEAVTAFLGL